MKKTLFLIFAFFFLFISPGEVSAAGFTCTGQVDFLKTLADTSIRCAIQNPLPSNCVASGGTMTCTGIPRTFSCLASQGIIGYSYWWNIRECIPENSIGNVPETEQAPPIDYQPIEPIPGLVNQDGNSGDFVTFINAVLRMLIVVGALVAVGALVIGGIMYTMTEVLPTKEKARKVVQNALYGFLLLLSAWLILNTVNPQLTIFGETESPGQTVIVGDTEFDETDYGAGGPSTPVRTPGFTSFSSASALGLEVLSSSQYRFKGYVGLITVGTPPNSTTILSPNPGADSSDTSAFLDRFSAFETGCTQAGGVIDLYYSTTLDRSAYYCGDIVQQYSFDMRDDDMIALENALSSILSFDCYSLGYSCLQPNYLIFSGSHLNDPVVQNAINDFKDGEGRGCNYIGGAHSLFTSVSGVTSGGQLVQVCYTGGPPPPGQ